MNDVTRRTLGFVFGLLLGLSYGLVSYWINPLFLPAIQLYYPDPGPMVNILLTCLNGGLIGLIAAWPEEALPGILAGALVGGLTTTLYPLRDATGGVDYYSGMFVLLVMTFLPRAALFLPIAGLTRWVLGVWTEEFQTVTFSIRRLALSLLSLILISGLVGILSLYPRYARQVLFQMDQIVQAGIQASDSESLPEPLKKVDGFNQFAAGDYTLQLSDNPDLLPVQRPIASYNEQEYAVYVRFANGYRFGCVFTPAVLNPSCIAF